MLKRIIYYLMGSFFIGFGVVLIIKSNLGTSPWDTLHVALSLVTPLTIGMAAQVVALVVTLIVTVVNKNVKYLLMVIPILLVGWIIDLFDLVILSDYQPEGLLAVITFMTGLIIVPLGGASLLESKFPAGVFDELMLVVMRLFKTDKMAITRIILECVPVITSLIITLVAFNNIGSIHFGTILFVLSVGPLLQYYLKIFRRLEHGNQ